MAKILNVFYEDKLVGILSSKNCKTFKFQYAESWLFDKDSFAISLNLPLSSSIYGIKESFAFFDNLLPEEEIRKIIASKLGINSELSFSLLEKLGKDCSGALSIVPENYNGDTKESFEQRYKPFTPEELIEYITSHRATKNDDLDDDLSDDSSITPTRRMSLAGAQEKTSVYIALDKAMYKSINGSPTTHIIKKPSTRFPNIVYNEIFCMGLAYQLGLEVAPFFATDTLPCALIVERFDRKLVEVDGVKIKKFHQEDFCQALGLESKFKYQTSKHKHASLVKCFELLDKVENPQQDKIRLLQWVVFNYLIGNADAHLKNISLLYIDIHKKPRLAPFYDLVSTKPYSISEDLALAIGDKLKPSGITAKHWLKFVEDIGMDKSEFIKVSKSLTQTLLTGIDEFSENFNRQYEIFPEKDSIVSTIKERGQVLLGELEILLQI